MDAGNRMLRVLLERNSGLDMDALEPNAFGT